MNPDRTFADTDLAGPKRGGRRENSGRKQTGRVSCFLRLDKTVWASLTTLAGGIYGLRSNIANRMLSEMIALEKNKEGKTE